MVRCAIVGCSNQSPEDKCHFFKLPAVIQHQRSQICEVTSEWRQTWLKAISREDLTKKSLANVFVCGKHFKKGTSFSWQAKGSYTITTDD